MAQPEEGKINRYQGVILAARRARELNEGVNAPEADNRKTTSIALEELEAGKLEAIPAFEKGTATFI